MNFNFTPPPAPSAAAIEAALGLISLISNPDLAKANLEALVEQTKAASDACAELAAERQRLTAENERAADLREKENLLAAKESDLEKSSVAQQVASSAIADRESNVRRPRQG